MKKYAQIVVVLGVFGMLVWIKQLGGQDQPAVLSPVSQQNQNTISLLSPTPTPSSSSASPSPTSSQGIYKDGTYTGPVTNAFYGNYQVQAIITGGKLTDVIFLTYPNDNRTSISINEQANVFLKEEALSAQSASVDIVSGASDSSQAFRQSLASALVQAK